MRRLAAALEQKFRHERGIIHPIKAKGDPLVGPNALMVMIPHALEALAKAAGAKETPFTHRPLYHLFIARGTPHAPFSLCGPFLGAPQAVMALEKLIALGARRFLLLGWCGSLQPGLRTGDLLLPLCAVSEEGTSAHYPIPGTVPESDPALNRILEEALEQQGLAFSKGSVWTTDAVYRETPSKVAAYQAQGVLAVDMEISALMTVALFRSVAMTGLLVVSDELFDLKWRPGFSDPLLMENTRAAGKVLLTLAASVGVPEKK